MKAVCHLSAGRNGTHRIGCQRSVRQGNEAVTVMPDGTRRWRHRRCLCHVGSAMRADNLPARQRWGCRDTGGLRECTETGEWLPVEDSFERQLVERLVRERRSFVKALRYNLPPCSRWPARC